MKAEIRDKQTYKIIGICMEVHNILGPGLLEAVYQESLEIEFSLQKIEFISQPEVKINYKNIQLKKYYKPDFIIENNIILEIKSEKILTNSDDAQIINALKLTEKSKGLLVNFGNFKLEYKRFVN